MTFQYLQQQGLFSLGVLAAAAFSPVLSSTGDVSRASSAWSLPGCCIHSQPSSPGSVCSPSALEASRAGWQADQQLSGIPWQIPPMDSMRLLAQAKLRGLEDISSVSAALHSCSSNTAGTFLPQLRTPCSAGISELQSLCLICVCTSKYWMRL